MAKKPWRSAPHLLEDHYTFEDAILNGLILITFLKHADRVKIACLAQLVNVIAPIITETDGPAWRQTIFYPFLHASRYGRGVSLTPVISTGTHDTSHHSHVTDIESAAVCNEEKEEVTIFAVNRHTKADLVFEADLRGFDGYRVKEYLVLESDDWKAVNAVDRCPVSPKTRTDFTMEQGIFQTVMKKCSWNVIVFSKI